PGSQDVVYMAKLAVDCVGWQVPRRVDEDEVVTTIPGTFEERLDGCRHHRPTEAHGGDVGAERLYRRPATLHERCRCGAPAQRFETVGPGARVQVDDFGVDDPAWHRRVVCLLHLVGAGAGVEVIRGDEASTLGGAGAVPDQARALATSHSMASPIITSTSSRRSGNPSSCWSA